MEVGEYYQHLAERDADPEKFDELCPSITDLDDIQTTRTIEALILWHAKLDGMSLKKIPYVAKKNKRFELSHNCKLLPVALRKILAAYLIQDSS